MDQQQSVQTLGEISGIPALIDSHLDWALLSPETIEAGCQTVGNEPRASETGAYWYGVQPVSGSEQPREESGDGNQLWRQCQTQNR